MTRSPQFIRLCGLLHERAASETNFDAIATLLTEELCRWFHCEWGTFWHVQGDALAPIVAWADPALPAQKLLADTQKKRLRKNEGNAGIVWRTGLPICADNLILEMCLPRSLDATEAGLRGGIWIPVVARDVALGVIELLGTHYWNNCEAFLHELSLIGVAVGHALVGEAPPDDGV